MAKVLLGARPKNFKTPVTFPMLDAAGEAVTGEIEVSFIYRTRTEFAEFIDRVRTSASDAAKLETQAIQDGDAVGKPVTVTDIIKGALNASATQILEAVDGWDLGVELNAAKVKQLADEYPAAIVAIMEKYRLAINEGRLEN